MAPIVVFVGAGSCIFARKILVDLVSFADLRPLTVRLHDIDPGRLAFSERMARQVVSSAGVSIESTTDRGRALDGADFVVSMFEPHGLEARRREVEVSISRGVPQSIGDTLGPAGVFKGIRTATVSLAVARDMERRCPGALLLSYVNPMAINCWAVSRLTRIACVGLCHGLEHTLARLAFYLGLPRQPESLAAGINHLCWLLTLRDGDVDLYPRLREVAPVVREDDPIRFSLMEAFGYFATESPYHVAEYLPYFRRRFAPLVVHDEPGPGRNVTMAGWAGAIVEPSAGPGGQPAARVLCGSPGCLPRVSLRAESRRR